MILSTPICKHLGLTNNSDKATDYLFIRFPEAATEVAEIGELIISVIKKGGLSIPNESADEAILIIGDSGLKFMTDTLLDMAVANGGILSGRVCVGVEVDTSVLDANVPVDYSPNGTITETIDGEEVTRQKKVRELMVHHEGVNGKSVLLAQEIVARGARGLVHDEYLRFVGFFSGYEVFNTETLADWKANNMTSE